MIVCTKVDASGRADVGSLPRLVTGCDADGVGAARSWPASGFPLAVYLEGTGTMAKARARRRSPMT